MSRWRSTLTLPAGACLVTGCLALAGLTLAAPAQAVPAQAVPAQAVPAQAVPADPAGPAEAASSPAVGVRVTGAQAAGVRAASGCLPAGGQPVPQAAAPASSGILVRGHGWGHGLGMSQYGAQGAALLGCTHAQILGTYYSGTHLQRRSLTAPVVLALKSGAARATVLAENGKVTWTAPAGTRVVQPAGQTWTVVGRIRNGVAGTALLDGAAALKLFVPAGTLKAAHAATTVRVRAFPAASNSASMDKRLRWGTAGFTRTASGQTVDETIVTDARGTSVDKYLWGLGEVPVSWPTEALRAQSDAARTYLTGTYSAGAYRIGTTTAAQVYAGAVREDEDARYGSPWRAAVNATSGEVVVDARSATISAMYSSSDGGRSESRAYVYGNQGGYGYLTSVDDSRWDLASSNPYRSWAKAFTPAAFATALGFSSVSAVSLAAPGTAGRAAGLKVTGVIGGTTRTVAYTGAAARSALGLRSSAFIVDWVQPAPTAPTALTVQPLTGDWDGDGRDDFGVFRSGQVTVRLTDGTLVRYLLGRSGDVAVVGDWDGDGKDSVGIFRAGTWYLRNALSAGPFDRSFAFGLAGDQPVTGNWAGAGQQGIGVVRAARWYLRLTATAGPSDRVFAYGIASDRAFSGDWDGDGADTPAVFRGGAYYLLPQLTSGSPLLVRMGRGTDVPVAGHWDGVPGDDVGLYRGQTYLYRDDLAGGVATQSLLLAG